MLIGISGMETALETKDVQLWHVHLLEHRCRPTRYCKDKSVCKARMLAGPDGSAIDQSDRRYRP